MRKIKLQLVLLSAFSFAVHAGEPRPPNIEAIGVREYTISGLCQRNNPSCAYESRKELEKYQLSCELQVQNLKCSELLKTHAEWVPLFRKCDAESFCKQNDEYLHEQSSACLRGFKNAAIKLGQSVEDLSNSLSEYVEQRWDKFKKEQWDKESFLKECDKSLVCKRELIANDPGYQNLSDEKLNNLPAAFLQKRAKRVEETLEQSKRKMNLSSFFTNDENGLSLSSEQQEKLMRLKSLILGELGQLEEKVEGFACYSPLAQEEMRCYLLGGAVDLVTAAGYFLKGGRALIALRRTQMAGALEDGAGVLPQISNAKEIANKPRANSLLEEGVQEKRTLLDPHVKKQAQDISVRTPEFDTMPHLPPSVKLRETTNIEGKTQLKYEHPVQLENGQWRKRTREFQIDELTGAINANYPAGRELFESIMHEKAGKAHFAWFDVGSLGLVNKAFVGGKGAGDRYIKAVADTIMRKGEGKITLARLGGDEFGLIIDEPDPVKVQKILSDIRKDLLENKKGDAHQVFREEKINRVKEYKQQAGSDKNREPLDGETGIARLRQDISIGSAQIGAHDNLHDLLGVAEDQAKTMKIETTLALGRSAKKYGSKAAPSNRPRPKYTHEVETPIESISWNEAKKKAASHPPLDSLPEVEKKFDKEIKRFKNDSLVSYVDETGHTSFFLERYVQDPKNGGRNFVSYKSQLGDKQDC